VAGVQVGDRLFEGGARGGKLRRDGILGCPQGIAMGRLAMYPLMKLTLCRVSPLIRPVKSELTR
jgi:hypothetical protein